MLLSKSSEYGIRASLYLASREESQFVSIREISLKLDIPFHFLTKIFQKLTRVGLMKSFRGPNGGVALMRPAEEISLRDIIAAIHGSTLFTECVLGLPGCGHDKPCPLHASWGVVREQMETLFAGQSLADGADKMRVLDLRLAAETPPSDSGDL